MQRQQEPQDKQQAVLYPPVEQMTEEECTAELEREDSRDPMLQIYRKKGCSDRKILEFFRAF